MPGIHVYLGCNERSMLLFLWSPLTTRAESSEFVNKCQAPISCRGRMGPDEKGQKNAPIHMLGDVL